MDADDYAVETVLAEGRRFLVPLYQRKYQWGDERLRPFWEDVLSKATEVLEGNCKFQHYMGALILAPLDEGKPQIGITPRVQVVDGQQRLTTFQIFLAALREVARDHEAADIIEQIQGYLFNQLRAKDTDPLTRFKLTPTPSDREVFHQILELEYKQIRWGKLKRYYWGNTVPKNTDFRSLRAYELFRQWITDFAQNGPVDWEPETEEADDETVEDVEATQDQPSSTNALAKERLEALLRQEPTPKGQRN